MPLAHIAAVLLAERLDHLALNALAELADLRGHACPAPTPFGCRCGRCARELVARSGAGAPAGAWPLLRLGARPGPGPPVREAAQEDPGHEPGGPPRGNLLALPARP